MTKRNKAVPGTRQGLGALADAAKGAADRAGKAIDDAMASIAAGNKRIAGMESAAPKSSKAPNATTGKAIAELEAGKGQRFASVDALMMDLHADDCTNSHQP